MGESHHHPWITPDTLCIASFRNLDHNKCPLPVVAQVLPILQIRTQQRRFAEEVRLYLFLFIQADSASP